MLKWVKIMDNIGNFIKSKRKEKGLTLKQVAKTVGVSEMTVSRWERGEIKNMKSDKIEKLAFALNIPVISLFDGWDLEGNKIEKEQITPRELHFEVKCLVDKTIHISDQEKNLLLQTLEFVCSDKE